MYRARFVALAISTSLFSACGGGGSDSGAASGPPPAGNTVPVAFDVSEKTNVNEVLSGMLSGQDADGDTLTYSITALPTLGNIDLTNSSTGAFRYTPDADAFGTDLFHYRVNDGTNNSQEAVVTVVINRVPVAQSLAIRAATDRPKNSTLPGSDADSDQATFEIVSPPTNGTISSLDSNTGQFAYLSSASFEGTDSFTFRVHDGFANSTTEIVTIDVDRWPGTMNLGMSGDEDAVYGLGIDGDDNLYVSYSTDASIAGAQSAGGTDVVLSKIDSSGSIIWQRQWGYSGDEKSYQIAMDPNGFLYMTVYTGAAPGAGPNYVLKFDLDGNLLWEFVAPQPDIFRLMYRMGVAASGNVYVSLRSNEAGILKVNSDGTLGWLKHFGTIAEDPSDPLLIGDYVDYNLAARGLAVDINETTYTYVSANYTPASTNVPVNNAMLVAVNDAGTIQTRVEPLVASTFPDGESRMGDLSLTGNQNIRMTGYFGGELSVAEFDVAGNEIWSTLVGDPGTVRFGYRAALTSDGSTIATGTTMPESMDPPESENVFVTKITNLGEFDWEYIVDSSPADESTEIADLSGQPVVDSDGDIFMIIRSLGGSIGAQPNQGGVDPLLLKLDGNTGEIIESN